MSENEGCLARILSFFGLTSSHDTRLRRGPLPYRISDRFLSPAELSFYHVLKSVVSDRQAVICPKVGLGELLFVSEVKDRGDFRRFRNYIDRKHVDFVLCDPKSMRPILAIELDDTSHKRTDRAERDAFVERAFEAAGLPLYHFPVRSFYHTGELGEVLREALGQHSGATEAARSQTLVSASDDAPLCPKCGIPMILRTVTRGPHSGKQFYGCQNYPDCREVKVIKG